MKWVTRVPATLSQAKEILGSVQQSQMQAESRGYFFYEQVISYGEIVQRWLLVLYEPKRERELKQLERAVAKEHAEAQKALKQLRGEAFSCEADAHLAVSRLTDKWKYHRLESKVGPKKRHAGPGRPRADAQPTVVWQIQGKLMPDEQHLSELRAPLGKYIVATNELDEHKLPTAELLDVYKAQNCSVERGFRLIPDQCGKPTKTPTMRRIFQMFDGIDVLIVQNGNIRLPQILNLRPIHQQMLALLGPIIQQFYIPVTYSQSWVT